jgi:ribose-phosphate pyrophosphokinase
MIETITHLKMQNETPICIGVHAVFAENCFQEKFWCQEIITCNTIPHKSNKIDIGDLLIL